MSQTPAALNDPARKGLVTEWYNNHEYGPTGCIGFWGGNFTPPSTPGPDRWDGDRALGFADGHVTFLQSRQILPSPDDCPDIDLTHDGVAGQDVN